MKSRKEMKSNNQSIHQEVMKELSTYIKSTYIESALKELVEFIEKDLNADYLVVGSCALAICGFPLSREVHDIDIEVVSSEKVKTAFRALQKSSVNKSNKSNNYTNHPDRLDFEWKGVTVNLWLVDKINKSYVWKNYIKYSTVSDVFEQKLKYGRAKDLKDLLYSISIFNSMINRLS